jgi:hypothetical protein
MGMSMVVNQRFDNAGDLTESSTAYLASLLERGVRVLIYSGMYDAVVSWLDSEYMTRVIEWTGRDAFGKEPLREWKARGEESSGKVRSWGPLTFVTIYAAGHLASSELVSTMSVRLTFLLLGPSRSTRRDTRNDEEVAGRGGVLKLGCVSVMDVKGISKALPHEDNGLRTSWAHDTYTRHDLPDYVSLMHRIRSCT